jgi:hypothetical protein
MYRRAARTLFAYEHPFLIDYRLSLSLLESGAGYHMRRPLGCYRAFHDQSATRGGKDFVGPGLLRTLKEYSISHPHLKEQISAHLMSAIVGRVRFQSRLFGILATRLAGQVRPPASGARQVFHANIPLKARLWGQAEYALNSLNFLRVLAGLGTLPPLRETTIGMKIAANQFAKKPVAADFFERKYGLQRRLE